MFGIQASALNWPLLLVVLSSFGLQRIRALFSAPLLFLGGLKCCLPRRSSLTGFEWLRLEDQSKQDPRLLSMGLCLVTLDQTKFKKLILTTQIFYRNYEMLLDLAVWSLLAQSLTWGYNCFGGSNVPALLTLYSFVPAASTLLYAVRVPLQVVYLTGWRAVETKVSCFAGVSTFAAVFVLLRLKLDPLNLQLAALGNDTALHLQALYLIMSPKPSVPSIWTTTMIFHLSLASLVGALAAGMVLASLRFSQTLLTILMSPQIGGLSKTMALLEHFWPLLLFYVLSGLSSSAGATGEAASDGVKLGAVAIFVALRLLNARTHLQCFLDTVTRSVALVPDGVDVASDPQLTHKIEARANYLIAAAAQILGLPLFSLAALLMCLRYSPTFGCSTCMVMTSLLGHNSDHFQVLSHAYAAIDATAATADIAAKYPYWSDVWGVMLHTHKNGGRITLDFFFKLGKLFPLPPHVVHGLLLAVLCVAALQWFSMSTAAAAYWYLAPEITGLKIALQAQHPPKPIPGGSQAQREKEAAALAAASAAGGRKEGERAKKD